MRVAVVGATGVIGRFGVPALVDAGHDVVVLPADVYDHDVLVAGFTGVDAVCSFAPPVPTEAAALRSRSWQVHDLCRTEGVRRVVRAAREAHVRRLLHESVSFQYADQGDDVVSEHSPLEITLATEPASVAESHVQAYTCGARATVVLRFGTVVDTGSASEDLGPLAAGSREGWAHVLHADDVGPAVLAGLAAPSGTYNVGAEPVRRGVLVDGLTEAVGRERVGVVGALVRRVRAARLEPFARSLRVDSGKFTAHTGWTPSRATFDASWVTDPALTDALP